MLLEFLLPLVYHILKGSHSQVLFFLWFLELLPLICGFLTSLINLPLLLLSCGVRQLLVFPLNILGIKDSGHPPLLVNLQHDNNLRESMGLSQQLHQRSLHHVLLDVVEVPIDEDLLDSIEYALDNLNLALFLVEVSSLLVEVGIGTLLFCLRHSETTVVVFFSPALQLLVLYMHD